jgi:hypothetical protein
VSPETWGSSRTPLTGSSMDADNSISTTNLLVDQMLSSSPPLCNGSPSVIGGRGGPPASLRHSESMFSSSGLGEPPTLRYMGNNNTRICQPVQQVQVSSEQQLQHKGDHAIRPSITTAYSPCLSLLPCPPTLWFQ